MPVLKLLYAQFDEILFFFRCLVPKVNRWGNQIFNLSDNAFILYFGQ